MTSVMHLITPALWRCLTAEEAGEGTRVAQFLATACPEVGRQVSTRGSRDQVVFCKHYTPSLRVFTAGFTNRSARTRGRLRICRIVSSIETTTKGRTGTAAIFFGIALAVLNRDPIDLRSEGRVQRRSAKPLFPQRLPRGPVRGASGWLVKVLPPPSVPELPRCLVCRCTRNASPSSSLPLAKSKHPQ